MNPQETIQTIVQVLLLEKRRKEEGITEGEVMLLNENYRKLSQLDYKNKP